MSIITDATTLIAILGTLAFITNVITQIFKDMGIIKSIPIALPSTIIALIVTVIAYLGYCSYIAIQAKWYMLVASIVVGFIVAYIALHGWQKICELYHKHKKK